MDLEFSEDQQELRSTVRSFLERECPMSLVRDVVEKGTVVEKGAVVDKGAIVDKGSPADDLWAQMVDLGWPALTVPEAHGGLGLGFVELAVVVEELGRAVAPGPFLATVTQFVPALRLAGSDDQQRRFLEPVAVGDLTGTLAVGRDVTAAPAADGWVLSGTVRHVVDGDRADELAVAARVDDGWGLFVVRGEHVRATSEHTLDQSRRLATVDLDSTPVEGDRVLGAPDSSASGAALDRSLEEATAALALEMVGTCQSIFDVALDYAKERHQFGVPIGSFQALKHKFADMLVALERARATAYFAAATIAEGDDRRTLAVDMAKAAAGDAQRLIAQEGISIMGGIGYTWEHDMHLYVKRAKAGDALLGTSSDHRARVAREIGL
ncbi:MAG: acyl-CoA/acyl-ACP dehydrogenase [Acidimicrobiia bacterium]|nr:acyl-CoA/acyl-ACP dehydrogenase [Acidimicrobiia bacterium]